MHHKNSRRYLKEWIHKQDERQTCRCREIFQVVVSLTFLIYLSRISPIVVFQAFACEIRSTLKAYFLFLKSYAAAFKYAFQIVKTVWSRRALGAVSYDKLRVLQYYDVSFQM